MLTGPLDDADWAGWAVAALDELAVLELGVLALVEELLDAELDVELAAVGAAAGAPDELHAWRIGAAMARIPSDVTNRLRETVTFSIY